MRRSGAIQLWWQDEDFPVAEIARRLGRSSSALWQLLGDEPGARAGVGRKAKLTDGDKYRLAKMVDDMVCEADTKYTVTAAMIQARFRPRVGLSVLCTQPCHSLELPSLSANPRGLIQD